MGGCRGGVHATRLHLLTQLILVVTRESGVCRGAGSGRGNKVADLFICHLYDISNTNFNERGVVMGLLLHPSVSFSSCSNEESYFSSQAGYK